MPPRRPGHRFRRRGLDSESASSTLRWVTDSSQSSKQITLASRRDPIICWSNVVRGLVRPIKTHWRQHRHHSKVALSAQLPCSRWLTIRSLFCIYSFLYRGLTSSHHTANLHHHPPSPSGHYPFNHFSFTDNGFSPPPPELAFMSEIETFDVTPIDGFVIPNGIYKDRAKPMTSYLTQDIHTTQNNQPHFPGNDTICRITLSKLVRCPTSSTFHDVHVCSVPSLASENDKHRQDLHFDEPCMYSLEDVQYSAFYPDTFVNITTKSTTRKTIL